MPARPRSALFVALAVALGARAAAQDGDLLAPARVAAVRVYIKSAWGTLTRSTRDLAKAAPDPKMPHAAGRPWPVYVPADEDRARVEAALKSSMAPADLAQIELRTLPAGRRPAVTDHGLLYLPRPYVVPGGRFNEMYGWDSYFIQVGLLDDGEVERARDMVENFLYEIEHYGTILNANRTYYLTRSQPPFLTEMVLGVYQRTQDREWLRRARPAIDAYYRFWTTEPHLVPGTGLSRYWDFGEGPAPEVLGDEKDAQGRTHYDRIREFYRDHPDAAKGDYDLDRFYDRKRDRLTDLFYKGDRSMRESGFDPSHRFGLFNVDIVHYAPVCLNTLLYRMETEATEIDRILGDGARAAEWRRRAQARREAVNKYLWDEGAGLYFDYDFETGKRRHYEFATTFYPLWGNLASPLQARRVLENLKRFEAPGGVLTSTRVTGNQWDAPYGWAPLQMIAVAGLRRYGFDTDADRLARKFLGVVVADFEEHGTIVEKYDVQRGKSDVEAGIKFGYAANQVGFGWTNAAFLDLLAGLERSRARRPAAYVIAPAGSATAVSVLEPIPLRMPSGRSQRAGDLPYSRTLDTGAYARPHPREVAMPLYMSQFAYTTEAWANLTKNPQDRTEAIGELAKKMGGRLVNLYYSFGEHDGVVISDVPDDVSAAALAMAAAAAGHVRSIRTTRLFTAQEAVAAMKKAGGGQLKPPKA